MAPPPSLAGGGAALLGGASHDGFRRPGALAGWCSEGLRAGDHRWCCLSLSSGDIPVAMTTEPARIPSALPLVAALGTGSMGLAALASELLVLGTYGLPRVPCSGDLITGLSLSSCSRRPVMHEYLSPRALRGCPPGTRSGGAR